MVDQNRGNTGKVKVNQGRSAEARDPNRPIDPDTGEKAGLGARFPDRDVNPDLPPPTETPVEQAPNV